MDDELDDSVRQPVVCTLIRDAVEFSCQEARGFYGDVNVTATEV